MVLRFKAAKDKLTYLSQKEMVKGLAAGDRDAFDKAAQRVKRAQGDYKAFCAGTGRTPRMDRTQVAGYNRSTASKATWSERKQLIHLSTTASFRMDLQLFAEKDLPKQKTSSIQKGIASLQEAIALHKSKLQNPQDYYKDWDEVSEAVRKGRMKHWKKELSTFEKGIAERQAELKRRGE